MSGFDFVGSKKTCGKGGLFQATKKKEKGGEKKPPPLLLFFFFHWKMAMIDESHLFREKKGATLGAKDRELKEKENLAALLPRRVPFHVARIPDNYASLKDKFIPVNGAFLTQTKGGPSSSSSSSSSSPSSSSSTLNGGPSGSSGAEKVEEEEGKLIADMLKWEKVQKIGSGLRNMGNTCFLNSSLQVTTHFSNIFLPFFFFFFFFFAHPLPPSPSALPTSPPSSVWPTIEPTAPLASPPLISVPSVLLKDTLEGV